MTNARTAPETSRDAAARNRREDAILRHRQSVAELLELRDDLVGVYPMADLIHDAVRWSA